MTTGRTAATVLGILLFLPGAASAQAGATTEVAGVAQAEGGVLTLAEALARARAYAPAIRAADAHATAGAAVADASRRWQGPRLDLSVENLGVKGLDRDGFAWITQPLDIGPRRSTRLAAARASQQWLAATADARRRETDIAVIDAYLTLVEVRQTAALLTGHESTIDEAVQVMARRVREGVAPEGDLRKLEAEAARTRLARIRAELALRQSSLALGVLIGRVDSTLGPHVVLPALLPVGDGHPDLASAVDQRADVRAALARVEERSALASAERAAGSAAFAAMAGYKRTSGFNTATAGVSIDLPFGARNATARLRAEADASAAVFELEQTRAAARADIESALLAVRVLAEEARRACGISRRYGRCAHARRRRSRVPRHTARRPRGATRRRDRQHPRPRGARMGPPAMTRTGFTPRRLFTTIAIATSVACSSTHEPRTTPPEAPTGGVALSPAGQAMAGIETQEVEVESAGPTLEAVGTVTLDDTRSARIGALVEGIVSRTLVDAGDRVRSGALLAGLHSHDVHDGWGDYRKAVADRRRVEQELAFADETLARTERLLADKAASVLEMERARASQAGARQQLIAATAEVRRAQESLEHLGIPVDASARSAEEIPVRTPRAGVVLERLVTAGTAVTPGDALFVVSDTSSLWVIAEVDEADIGRVSIGSPVEVVVSAYPSERFAARVARIGDSINPATRRAIVRCTVANADGRLKPGMFARVTMAGAGTSTRVRVPVDAVQDLGDRRVVFVSDGSGRYTARDVETGPERDGRIDVRHGLAAGDSVVTRGAFLLKSQVLGPSAGEP